MANQGLDRRTALEMLAKAAFASQFTGFSRWSFGATANEHQHAHGAVASPSDKKHSVYTPQYFSAHEYQTVDILTDLIIPADETPGAKEAGVAEFIDFMAAHGETEIRQPLRDGLLWLDSAAQKQHGSAFASLPSAQQNDLLKTLAYRNPAVPVEERGVIFFRLVRRYTVMGYYTSRVGLAELDYPGLRLYSQSPACPHTDDPEHLHLNGAKV